MLNIAVITSGYLPVPPTKGGAVESIIYNLVKKNEEYGKCFITVYSIEDEEHSSFKNAKIEYIKPSKLSKVLDKILYFCAQKIFRKKHLISYRYFFQRMEFYRKVGKKINKKDYDRIILENNVVMFESLKYRDNFKKYDNKIIYHAHNELVITLGNKKYLNKVRKIIGVSDFITNKYKEYINSTKVEFKTVHNSVDEKIFNKDLSTKQKNDLIKKLNINSQYPILLFAGRISEEKGILELLKALSLLNTYEYNLLILGKPFYGTDVKDELEGKLQDLAKNIKGNIIFTGLINHNEMYKYYKMADLCILPSIWNEPFGLTIAESIISKTPLITTNVGGIPELATKSTIMLNVDNVVNELKETLENLLNNKKELEELKQRTKKENLKYDTLDDYYFNFIKALE